jgi:hypothetical protein
MLQFQLAANTFVRAFRDELVPQDSNDESAEELLKRLM